jgi:hypothetical protein
VTDPFRCTHRYRLTGQRHGELNCYLRETLFETTETMRCDYCGTTRRIVIRSEPVRDVMRVPLGGRAPTCCLQAAVEEGETGTRNWPANAAVDFALRAEP